MALMMKQIVSFLKSNLTVIILLLLGILALTMYARSKGVERMESGRNGEETVEALESEGDVEPSKPLGTNEDYAKVSGITTSTPGLSSSCTSVSTVSPSDLLPTDQNNEWAKLNPTGQGELADVNLLQAWTPCWN